MNSSVFVIVAIEPSLPDLLDESPNVRSRAIKVSEAVFRCKLAETHAAMAAMYNAQVAVDEIVRT